MDVNEQDGQDNVTSSTWWWNEITRNSELNCCLIIGIGSLEVVVAIIQIVKKKKKPPRITWMNFKCGFCVFMVWVFGGSVWLWPLLYCRQSIVVFCVDVILVVGWCQLEFDLCACATFGRQVNWGKLCVPLGFQEREKFSPKKKKKEKKKRKKERETISLLCLVAKKVWNFFFFWRRRKFFFFFFTFLTLSN